MNIGDWVQRERRGKAHKVESVVAGDAVTKCGRRLADEANSNGELLLTGPADTLRCKVCVRHEPQTWTISATNTESTTVSYP